MLIYDYRKPFYGQKYANLDNSPVPINNHIFSLGFALDFDRAYYIRNLNLFWGKQLINFKTTPFLTSEPAMLDVSS